MITARLETCVNCICTSALKGENTLRSKQRITLRRGVDGLITAVCTRCGVAMTAEDYGDTEETLDHVLGAWALTNQKFYG